jgi:hypothetical protein
VVSKCPEHNNTQTQPKQKKYVLILNKYNFFFTHNSRYQRASLQQQQLGRELLAASHWCEKVGLMMADRAEAGRVGGGGQELLKCERPNKAVWQFETNQAKS